MLFRMSNGWFYSRGKRVIYLTLSLTLSSSLIVDHCYFALKLDVKGHQLSASAGLLGKQQHTCQIGSLFPVSTGEYSAAEATRAGTDG